MRTLPRSISSSARLRLLFAALLFVFCLAGPDAVSAQAPSPAADDRAEIEQLRAMVLELQSRVDGLEHQLRASQRAATPATSASNATPASAAPPEVASADASPAPPVPAPPAAAASPAAAAIAPAPVQPKPLAGSVLPAFLPGGATLNYTVDGYYEYNFNQPPGRANDLRAYDVLSNTFSINQAAVILALDPDVRSGRRFGARLDLQFGQATATLQGNPANEPRPQIYQNIFQAYGTYVVPIGSGLTVDAGKWASSLGVEGNYSKDQLNYTRSFFFYFLPSYHEGVRTSYKFNDKVQANYWLVNGVDQTESAKGFKDEMFGFVLNPAKTLTWTSNYYLGAEHPDAVPAANCPVPLQPGLCAASLSPAPNGKLHIFDNYVTWQAMPKLMLIAEGDYVLQRQWANAAPGESSAPSHVDGGAAYAQYQFTPTSAFSLRGEYMSDRQGLFSGRSQALKEATVTYKRNFADGFDAFLEYRTDWSNVPYFQTHNTNSAAQHQTTATVGLVWWYGGKQGSW